MKQKIGGSNLSKKNPMQTITRAIQVLKAFSFNETEFTLTELSQKLEISKSSMLRILDTLRGEGLLKRDERSKTYKLGIELYFLGNLVEKDSHLLAMTNNWMRELNRKTEETITLNIVYKNQRKCIAYELAKHELTTLSYISKESPLYAGASAKVLLANLPEETRIKVIEDIKLEGITDYTVNSKKQLEKQLNQIRIQGYAITKNERVLGVCAISAPIKNRLNEVIASLTITIPLIRLNQSEIDHYVELLLKYTNYISVDLGSTDQREWNLI